MLTKGLKLCFSFYYVFSSNSQLPYCGANHRRQLEICYALPKQVLVSQIKPLLAGFVSFSYELLQLNEWRVTEFFVSCFVSANSNVFIKLNKNQLDAHLFYNHKIFIILYVALHVSDTTVSIIRSLPPLHMQLLVTMRCCVGYVLQPCSVVTAVGCMCSGGRLLMMDTVVSETCRAT
jgi:hypothetical protein